jgi:5-methylcytosine-specific restriction endonuclease McrA
MSSDIPTLTAKAQAIKQRDRNTCQRCRRSRHEIVGELEVHEIVPSSGVEESPLSNYVLLCRGCHDEAHQRIPIERE